MEKKITTYFNFMPKKLYEKIYDKSRKITWTINPQLDGKYSNHLTYQMIDEGLNENKLKQPYKQLVQFISEKINRKVFPHNMYYNLYQHGNECGIHVDRNTVNTNLTCIIYLTDDWSADWHGQTNFYSDDETKIICSSIPYPNHAVIFDSSIKHGVSPISKNCYKDRIILVLQLDIKK
jgi:Rps23 Pro-64 3,4-dihydroxylase Tpa1-like proline 4-hydroxylase